jgi:hypothetical protein
MQKDGSHAACKKLKNKALKLKLSASYLESVRGSIIKTFITTNSLQQSSFRQLTVSE